MAASRSSLIVTMWMWAILVPAACADDNDRYGELAAAADELGGSIAGTEVSVIAAPSSCVVAESCPDVATVDLPERSDLSLDEIAAVATSLGWEADVVDARLIIITNGDDMSGSISLDAQRWVVLAVGED